MRVLIVEDNHVALRYMAKALREANHDVVAVGSRAEAEAALENFSAQVVVADMGLPDGTGVEIGLLAREQRPELHVVICSGLPPLDLPEGFHFLTKPFSMKVLVKLVESFV
jgi:DNA-binding response OmpR family regulator